MLFELSLIPINASGRLSDHLAEAARIIDKSGLNYEVTPSSTCVTGDWDAVMPVLKRCHEKMRTVSDHVVTTIKVEDDAISPPTLSGNVGHVAGKSGRSSGEGRVDSQIEQTFPASDPPSFMPGEV